MKQRGMLFIVVMVAIVLVVALWFTIEKQETYLPAPTTNNGQKWRIAYYEGGPYTDYVGSLRGMVDGLVKLGWIEDVQIPEFDNPNDTWSVWEFLAANVKSEYLSFVADAYWSAGWADDARRENRQHALHRLSEVGDIDFIIAMGTWAGQDLATDEHSVPTMVINSSDPIRAGIIKSVEDSGYDHVAGEVDPDRWLSQLRLFHDIVGFARLGAAYEDSADGRIYANVADLETVAAERGFEIISCYASDSNVSEAEARHMLARCYRELAPQVDALWIGVHRGEIPELMPQVLVPLFEHQVATWAQAGPPAVRRGALMSITQKDYAAMGQWHAERMAQIFNGTRPRDLAQVFELPKRIVINLETARRIGFELPPGVLEIADQVYEIIEGE